ncbi:hypothetical protein C942_02442 [Photobacterium marinum]|uniref:N-acetyltransferase domain-containing protein n=1 Tax=Photobacterium marinum TaxID=1056511 RepID=L8JA43_9GAMM|nr:MULTISPECIES: GNAT family N-acetyltransferase [Photobacterium]ELR64419.1 hypothetical protein C942_02442 [Photobacterium marinum]
MIHKLLSTEEHFHRLTTIAFDELRTIYQPTKLAHEQKSQSHEKWEPFGYFIGNNLVGCIEVSINNDVMNLRTLAVAKGYRRQGIARKLIDGVLPKYSGVKSISVWCVEQTGNVTVFKHLGFEVTQSFYSKLFELQDGSKAVEVQLMRDVMV